MCTYNYSKILQVSVHFENVRCVNVIDSVPIVGEQFEIITAKKADVYKAGKVRYDFTNCVRFACSL